MMKLTDVFEIRPDPKLVDLSKKAKHKLMDSALNPKDSSKRGLLVHFNLSSSARRINNRIYTPRGQIAGIDSWTQPFAKPIIRNHDSNEDPIGRFASVTWESTDNQAMSFFKDITGFMDFKRQMDTNDPKKIYRALRNNHLLTDAKWPGLGYLEAGARISDEDAVEKFLDGRYLTFSAGTNTDRYCCGICGSDWAQQDICDHLPGRIHDKGMVGVFITGTFIGSEASIVNTPANTMSKVLSMEFADSARPAHIPEDVLVLDQSIVYFTDARVEIGETMNTPSETSMEDVQAMDVREVIQKLAAGDLGINLVDQLSGDTHFETSWLVKIHDVLHSQYDYQVRYADGDDLSVPTAVFGLHGKLHDLSQSGGFRDSLLNGPLDRFDSKGGESEEYLIKGSAADSDTNFILTDEQIKMLVNQLALVIGAPTKENPQEDSVETDKTDTSIDPATAETDAKEQTDSTTSTPEEVAAEADAASEQTDTDTAVDVPWALLDLGLEAALGDTKLSAESREALDASAFCGPDRSFPLSDATHIVAARTLVESSKLSADQKKLISDSIDVRAEAIGPAANGSSCKCGGSCANANALRTDYAEALRQIDTLRADQEKLKKRLAELDKDSATIQNEDKADPTSSVSATDNVQTVGNPSIASSENASKKTIGKFEQKIVDTYKQLLDQQGQRHADNYLNRKINAGHLPRKFNISQHIQEND